MERTLKRQSKLATKLAIERILDFLPRRPATLIHFQLQRWGGSVGRFDEAAVAKEIERGLRMLKFMVSGGVEVAGKRVLEIGTGWHCGDVILFYLAGAESVVTVDHLRHEERRLTRKMINGYLKPSALEAVSEIIGNDSGLMVRANELRKRASSLWELDELEYYAPSDCLEVAKLRCGEFDLFYSYSVLQRLPGQQLRRLLDGVHQCLSEGGASCHVVHHQDHHARHGLSGPFSYLGYGPWYELIQSRRFNYQSRLRHTQIIDLFADSGVRISTVEVERAPHEHLDGIEVGSKFQRLSVDDLRTVRTALVAKRVRN